MKNMDFIIVNDSLREAKILASVEIVELLLSIGIALLVIYYSLVTQRKTINIFKNKKEKKNQMFTNELYCHQKQCQCHSLAFHLEFEIDWRTDREHVAVVNVLRVLWSLRTRPYIQMTYYSYR